MTAVSHRKQQKPWKVVPRVWSFRNVLIMQYANSKWLMRCLLSAGKSKMGGEQGRHNPAKMPRSETPSRAPSPHWTKLLYTPKAATSERSTTACNPLLSYGATCCTHGSWDKKQAVMECTKKAARVRSNAATSAVVTNLSHRPPLPHSQKT